MPNIDVLSWTIEAQLKFYLMIALMALFKKQKSAKKCTNSIRPLRRRTLGPDELH